LRQLIKSKRYCKTSQFKTVCNDDIGYVTELKLQKSNKMILLISTLTLFIYYESRTKVHIKNKNKNYAYDTHK